MREIKLGVDGFMEILSEALEEVPPLRAYNCCPKCGRTPVEYNLLQKRHQCPWRDCPWREEKESLPLRAPVTGRDLSSREILAMVLGYLMRK